MKDDDLMERFLWQKFQGAGGFFFSSRFFPSLSLCVCVFIFFVLIKKRGKNRRCNCVAVREKWSGENQSVDEA